MKMLLLLFIVSCYAGTIDIEAGQCYRSIMSFNCPKNQLIVHLTYSSDNGDVAIKIFKL